MMMRKNSIAILTILLLAATMIPIHPAAAKPGDLDTTFGTSGSTSTLLLRTTAVTGAIQADGKIIAVGQWQTIASPYSAGGAERFALARYKTDGTLDTTFGGNGTVTTGIGSYASYNNWNPISYATGVAIQTDGKIVVVGQAQFYSGSKFAVARYNPDGSLDSSFNGNGTQTLTIAGTTSSNSQGVAIQSDGKIVVVGSAYASGAGSGFAMARLTTSGSLDSTFGSGGTVSTQFGWYTYNPSYHYAYAYAVAIQSDGRIILGGSAYSGYTQGIALARYGTNGVLDPSFGGNSNGTTIVPLVVYGSTSLFYSSDQIASLAIQQNGQVLAGASYYEGIGNFYTQGALLAQFHADGTVNTTFGNNGFLITPLVSNPANGLALQTDGRVVISGTLRVGGANTFELARYWGNGTIDSGFGNMGTMEPSLGANNAFAAATLIQSDGKVVVVGTVTSGASSGFIVARYLTADTIAPTWSAGATLAASNVGQTTLTLIWTPSSDDVAVSSYRIYQGTTLLATVQGSVLSYNVTGLTAGTAYKFTVQAGDAGSNWSTNGPTLNVSTAPGLPLVPILVIVAIAAGFAAALFLTKPKTPKTPTPT